MGFPVIEIDLNTITSALRDSALSNITGLVGGLLGLLTFLSQLPKRIKPLIFVSDNVKIYLQDDNSTIDRIQTTFSIYNNSNRNFLITDLFAKIYENNSYTPKEDIFHVTHIIHGSGTSDFSATQIKPYESGIYEIVLSENLLGRSKKRLDKSANYTIELFMVVNNLRLFAFPRIDTFCHQESDERSIILRSLSSSVNRKKYESLIKKQRKHTSYYKGVTGRALGDVGHFIKYKMLLRPFWVIRDILSWVALRPYFLWGYLKHNIIMQLVFKRYGRKTYKSAVTFGNKDDRSKTEITMKKLLSVLSENVSLLNRKNKNQITITSNERQIVLEKNEYKLNIYISGDGFITANRLESTPEIQLSFNLRKRYLFNHWMLDKKVVSVYDMATTILDLFLERTLYKR